MNRAEIREARVTMRRIEAHLHQTHLNLGAENRAVGMVQVFHHQDSALPSLNYVTPRRNTAWVSRSYIEQGLEAMLQLGRRPRVRFADGLYPPVFTGALRDLGLHLESEIPIMMYRADDHKVRKTPAVPNNLNFNFVTDQESMAMWWYVWRNAYYDVVTSTAEPLYIGRDMRDTYLRNQFNLIMYRERYPIGVSRVTMHNGTAHLTAQAIMKEFRTPEWDKILREVTLDAAIREGNDLIFSTGANEAMRQLYRSMNFVDSGSIVCYADTVVEIDEAPDDTLEHSVLVV